MIKEVELTRFKKYKSQSFSFKANGVTLLVGGNNAGKSTIIHALAVWEFCKMILLHEKGRKAFNAGEVGNGEGFGMSAEEFLPIAVPTLNHLWTNLKTQLSPSEKAAWPDQFPGYIMRIKCVWDHEEETNRILEFGLSLVNDRLFIRVTKSNLVYSDYLPSIVYLPTFAGVLPKESKATIAERRAYLGRGMAGSIIRNMIYDLYILHSKIRDDILGEATRLSDYKKKLLESNSPLLKLQKNLKTVFNVELEIEPFNEDFHTVLKIYERKLAKNDNGELVVLPKSKYTPRDIISQGSGFLQWLSIFCIIYTPDIDVLLLDEPDAHLHASLQSELLSRLIANADEKQIFVSTHSVEIIKQAPLDLVFSMEKRKYLSEESSRIAVINGIGSEYFPKLDLLERYKKLIFIENDSDKKILEILGEQCGILLPNDVVYWTNTDSHQDRRHMFEELRKIIPSLKCISLRDRDMDNPNSIGDGLEYKTISLPADSPILLLEWRRKNIESYLLCPKAIAAATEKEVDEVKKYLSCKFAIAISDDGFVDANPPEAIITLDGKNVFIEESIGLEAHYNCNKYDVAKKMSSEEICQDIKTFLTRVNAHFSI